MACGPSGSYGTVASISTFGYARPEDGAYIAYRVEGDGPIDVVWQPDWTGNIDMEWQDPLLGSLLRELSSFARVITHDHRGVGLSSRNVDLPTLETRVSDLLAVLRATGTRRPVLVGVFASGAVNALLAATRPSLPRALVWLEPSARAGWAPDYPWGSTEEERDLERGFLTLWGTDAGAKAFTEEEEAHENPLPGEHIEQGPSRPETLARPMSQLACPRSGTTSMSAASSVPFRPRRCCSSMRTEGQTLRRRSTSPHRCLR
jgi:pimeloyl-ACP methyl ester carboxylesterase